MYIDWVIKDFGELSSLELYKILQLRINIFMLEQQCLYPECDDKDLVSKHLLGIDQGEIVAYARLLPDYVSYEDPSIGRVVVREDKRSQQLGYKLMKEAIAAMHAMYPRHAIRISAQAHLQNFYQNLGFSPEGETYLEDNIPHIEMVLYP